MENVLVQTSSDEKNRRSGAESLYLVIACRGLSKALVDRLTSISDGVEKPRIELCTMFTPRNDADFRSIFVSPVAVLSTVDCEMDATIY